MRADEELGQRVTEAERRVLRATEVKAQEERAEEPRTTEVKAAGTDDMRAIDDPEAQKVWSELSDLDPKIRGE
eukprot:5353158-Amphidinium_carterae.1